MTSAGTYMCPSRSAEALRGHINVPFTYKELKLALLKLEDGDNSTACSFPACDHQFKFKKVEEDDVLRLLRGLDVNSSMT